MKLTPLLLLCALPVFAIPPDPTMDSPTTRVGYKARNDRQRAHEVMFALWTAHGKRIPVNGGQAMVYDTPIFSGLPTCKADVIAIVTLYNQRPVLSRQENFIFTEYKVEVNETIKGNLRVGERTTIAYPGGEINLPGDHFTYTIQNHAPWTVGSKYLVFLKYLPITNDYTILDTYSAHEVEPGGNTCLMAYGAKPTAGLLTKVRATANECVGGQQ